MSPLNALMAVSVSPVGKLGITIAHESLVAIHFLSADTKLIKPESLFAREVISQLSAFFEHKLAHFDLPLSPQGTSFRQKVWQTLETIPYGQTVTYGELAKTLSTGPRAIGNACRVNPLPIVIPCHRVVARNSLGGYAGAIDGHLLSIKTGLLQHERVYATLS